MKFFLRNWEVFYAKKWNFKNDQPFDKDIIDGGKELLDEIVVNYYDKNEKKERLHGDKIANHFSSVKGKIVKTNKHNQKIREKEETHDKNKQLNKLQ